MEDTNNSNVVSLFGNKNEQDEKVIPSKATEEETESQFELTMKKNAENAKRMKDSRLKSNKSVIRSYRLKT